MQNRNTALLFISLQVLNSTATAESRVLFSGEKPQNNLVMELLDVEEISQPGSSFVFRRARAGYIIVSADCRGKGTVSITLDDALEPLAIMPS